MPKECWQLKACEPTPCFIASGSMPCLGNECPVSVRIGEIEGHGVRVDSGHLNLLLHAVCRISSLSVNNIEFRERIDNQLKRNSSEEITPTKTQ